MRRVAVELLIANHHADCLTCAQNNMCELQRIATYVGVDKDRLLVDWVSAAEGRHFAEVTTEFTAQVRELGPWGGKRIDG